MLWRDMFFLCFLTVAALSMIAEGSRFRDLGKKHENDVSFKEPPSVETGAWNPHGKQKRLFARRGLVRRQRPLALQRAMLQKPNKQPKQPKQPKVLPAPPAVPPQRCPRVMESCVPQVPCCDPCATCHCRFFNTICYCWRIGRLCPKKS
ncbi:hypothetical protein JZ751_010290 [Albula glossodonta]|uniref:Agouti domain-containing protein n=1 Tax=Albula glossodonta TaxID=121402 RepID=A0A8T2MZM0_9TELE|nr:hypothetical protein JZ751_010290 [Albula glossodonta]